MNYNEFKKVYSAHLLITSTFNDLCKIEYDSRLLDIMQKEIEMLCEVYQNEYCLFNENWMETPMSVDDAWKIYKSFNQ